MGNLSKNFSRHEFKCPCCNTLKLNPRLTIALQDLRDLAGEPILILSGYRCQNHNANVGGAVHSQHMLGRAADIRIMNHNTEEMAQLAEQVPAFHHGGIGTYTGQNRIHVDIRDTPARWSK